MNEVKRYLSKCSKCKKKTIHIVYQYNLKRGVKLRCINCFNRKTQYSKVFNLTEFNKREVEKDE